jgi:aspartate aminotransferase
MAVLILLILAVLISARTIASFVIDYQWWKEMGQLATWFSMLAYRVTPVVVGALLAFGTLLVAHNRALRFARVRRVGQAWYHRIVWAILLAMAVFISANSVDTWTVVRYFGGLHLPPEATTWQDAIFGKHLSFYLFNLPFYLMLRSYLLAVTIGGSEGFTFAIQTACNPGDEILVPEPFYPNYKGQALVNGVNVVPITTRIEDGFHLPEMEGIERLITDRTKAILFSTPSNPTGVAYTRDEMQAIADLAIKHDLYVISDEPYRELLYDGEAVSIMEFPELHEHAILVDSISKRLSACGARIGTLVTRNRELMKSIDKLCMIRLSAPTFEQLGLVSFLNDPHYQDDIAAMREKFHSRRDTLYEALQKIPGVVSRKPEGAFYVFAKFPQIDDSEEFVKFMLNEFNLDGETTMVAPGAGFYATPGVGNDEIRIAYVLEEHKLVRAVEVLKAGLEAYVEQRQRMATLLRSLPDGVALLDDSGGILLANDHCGDALANTCNEPDYMLCINGLGKSI